MITLPQGFKIGSTESVDTRLVLTKAEMLAMKDNLMPQVYFAVCKDDGKIYVYNKENVTNEITGKFLAISAEGTSSWGKLGE